MSLSNADQGTTARGMALFNLGFRPFFLGASGLAVIAIGLWLGVYRYGLPITFSSLPPSLWHAHELIFGYAVAVIAGFLLTAVRNWTGIQTSSGLRLCILFALWAAARIAYFFGDAFVAAAAAADLTFLAALCSSLLVPLVKAGQWRQMAVISKLILIGAANVLFYAGVFGLVGQGARWGIYTALYLVIGLILTMGQRVIPGFIERGVGYSVTLVNRRWVDLSSMALFVFFFLLDTFTPLKAAAGWMALALFLLHSIRAIGWHTPGIWRRPLLWSLYGAYLFLVLGFGLYALSALFSVGSYFLAVHAFAAGGIGLITISMMGRVALGHTGRNIHSPPKLLAPALGLVSAAAFVRVLLPLAFPQHYLLWIPLSALLWMIGFTLFAVRYASILTRARVDGLPG